MVEIEIGVLVRQCLARRLGDVTTLQRETAAWNQQRNRARARIDWLFDVRRAREDGTPLPQVGPAGYASGRVTGEPFTTPVHRY